jgi:hypothetical protein
MQVKGFVIISLVTSTFSMPDSVFTCTAYRAHYLKLPKLRNSHSTSTVLILTLLALPAVHGLEWASVYNTQAGVLESWG